VANLLAKFEVSSFNRSGDIKGVPKFYKMLSYRRGTALQRAL